MFKFRLFTKLPNPDGDIYEFTAKSVTGAKIKSASIIRNIEDIKKGYFCRLEKIDPETNKSNKVSSWCTVTRCWVEG